MLFSSRADYAPADKFPKDSIFCPVLLDSSLKCLLVFFQKCLGMIHNALCVLLCESNVSKFSSVSYLMREMVACMFVMLDNTVS